MITLFLWLVVYPLAAFLVLAALMQPFIAFGKWQMQLDAKRNAVRDKRIWMREWEAHCRLVDKLEEDGWYY